MNGLSFGSYENTSEILYFHILWYTQSINKYHISIFLFKPQWSSPICSYATLPSLWSHLTLNTHPFPPPCHFWIPPQTVPGYSTLAIPLLIYRHARIPPSKISNIRLIHQDRSSWDSCSRSLEIGCRAPLFHVAHHNTIPLGRRHGHQRIPEFLYHAFYYLASFLCTSHLRCSKKFRTLIVNHFFSTLHKGL